MKAYKITAPRTLVQVEEGAQAVPDNAVKVKMLKCAIGAVDGLVYKGGAGVLPVVPGRHGLGLVTETGKAVTKLKRGDRVYVGAPVPCGSCAACLKGKAKDCIDYKTPGLDADGLLCDFIVMPESDLFSLPQKVTDTETLFIERTAAGIGIIDALAAEKGEHIVIVGAGVTGLILAQLALYYQLVPILVDVHRDRLDIAESMGIYYTVDAVSSDPVKKIFSITCGQMAEALAYTMPSAMPFNRAFECLAPGGRAVISGRKGLNSGLNLDLEPLLMRRQTVKFLSVSPENTPSAINIFASGAIEADRLLTTSVPFADAEKVIAGFADDPTKYVYAAVDIDKI